MGATSRSPFHDKPDCKDGSPRTEIRALIRDLTPQAEALLAAELAPEARSFVREIVRQIAHPVSGPRTTPREEMEITGAVIGLIFAARDEELGGAAGARASAVDEHLLSSAFQNLDLLYQEGYPGADGVSLFIMGRLWGTGGDD